ncbi:MAG: hypothetical protein KGD59_15640 [Candidatus Heimdallarchaeota archaeon]|nr:hypothetical protein [Candidatus Heimdallarchaeota archaeon]
MKFVCFDTNYLLAVLIPLDRWKPIIKLCEKEITELVEKGKVKVFITKLVKSEAYNRIEKIVKNATRHFKTLFHKLKDTNLKTPFEQNSILSLRKELQLILKEEDDEVIRNQLYYFEDYLLKAIRKFPEKAKKIIIGECLSEINGILTSFDAELSIYDIDEIADPLDKEEIKKLEKIKTRINTLVPNFNDKVILATFIYFINLHDVSGIFVTHDFKHLLLKSLFLEEEFKEINIVRPQYVKFLT